jgi:uncharacterized protein GlcG (DUF336 family)
MKQKPTLQLSDVKKIVAAAEQAAAAKGWCVSIAVCDDGGHLLFLERMDNAAPLSAAVAPEKARTCALARRASKAYEDMINQGRFAALRMPVVPLEGGEMIVVDGCCVGAVGVSGALASDDALVARAGVAAIGAGLSI